MLHKAAGLVQQMSEHQSVRISTASRQNSSKSLPKRKKQTTISINKNQKKMPTENNDTASVKSNGSMNSNQSKKKQTSIKPSKGLLNKNNHNLMPNLQSRSPQQNSNYQTAFHHQVTNRFEIEQSEVKNFQVITDSNKWGASPIEKKNIKYDKKEISNVTEDRFVQLNVQLKAPPKFSPFNQLSDKQCSDEEPVIKINQPQKLKKDSFVTNDPKASEKRKNIYQQNVYENQVESTYSKQTNQSQRNSNEQHSRIFGTRRQTNQQYRNKSNEKGQQQRKNSKSKLGGLLRQQREKNESKFMSNFSNASIGSLKQQSKITASKIPGNYPRGQMTKVRQIQLNDNSDFDLGSDLQLSHSQHDHRNNVERGKQSLQFVFQKEKKKGIAISSKNIPVLNIQESSQMVDITGNLVSKSIPRPLQKVAFNKQQYAANNNSFGLNQQQDRDKQQQKRKMKQRIIQHNRKLEEQRKNNQYLKRQEQQKQTERLQRLQQQRDKQLQKQRIIKANREKQQRERLQRIEILKKQSQQQKARIDEQRQIQAQRSRQKQIQLQNQRKKQLQIQRKKEIQKKIEREREQYRELQLKKQQERRQKQIQQLRARKQMQIQQTIAQQRQLKVKNYESLNNAPSTYSKDLSSSSDRSRSKDGKRKKQTTIKTSKPISRINNNIHVSPRAERSFYQDQADNRVISQAKLQEKRQFKVIDIDNQVKPLTQLKKQQNHDVKRKLISFSEQQDGQQKYTIRDELKSQTDVNFYNPKNISDSSQKDLSQHSCRKPPSSRPPLSKKSVGSSSHSKSKVKESSLSRQKAGNIMKKDKNKTNNHQNATKKLSLLQLAMRKDSGSEFGRSDSEADDRSEGSRNSNYSKNSKGSKKSLKKQSSIKMKENVLNINRPQISPTTLNYGYHEPIKAETQMKIEPRKIVTKDVFFINQQGRLVKQDLIIQGSKSFGQPRAEDVQQIVYQKMKRSREKRKSRQLERSRSRSQSRFDNKDKSSISYKINNSSSRGFATDYDQSGYDGSRVQNDKKQTNTLREFIKPNEQIPMRKNQQLQRQFYDEEQGYSSYHKGEQMAATTLNDLFGKSKKNAKLEHSASKRSIHRTEKSNSRRY